MSFVILAPLEESWHAVCIVLSEALNLASFPLSFADTMQPLPKRGFFLPLSQQSPSRIECAATFEVQRSVHHAFVVNQILILPLQFSATRPKTAPTLCALHRFSTKSAHVSPHCGPSHRHTTVNLRIFHCLSKR
jgi:hypothetical protein